jgi:hypothetical protein
VADGSRITSVEVGLVVGIVVSGVEGDEGAVSNTGLPSVVLQK